MSGHVVISQVRPPNAEGQSYNAPAKVPQPIVRFYRGEPEVLGVIDMSAMYALRFYMGMWRYRNETTQIFVGILLLSIDIPFIIAETKIYSSGIVTVSGVPMWSGILFITSGSLSVSASWKPTVGKITASLVMNIFSSLAAACGVIMSGQDVSAGRYGTIYRFYTYCAYYNNDPQCRGTFTPLTIRGGLLSYVLLLFTLVLCISISTSVFASKTICRTSFEETTVVIYQTTTVNVSDRTREDPPDYSPAGTSD